MKHIVSHSGGIGSFVAATRVVERYGKENTLLVFADTLIEDPDLYRFLEESAKKLKVQLIQLMDGRTPWDVFKDVKYIGNSRIAQCSKILKREPFERFLNTNFGPDNCIIYLGIDWSEIHRLEPARINNKPYKVEAPLCEPPYLSKEDMLKTLKKYRIEIPSLYKKGFSHNNCGGFCVRAGQGQFKKLLEEHPGRYEYHEEEMERVMNEVPNAKPFMKVQKDGIQEYITLKQFRERLQKGAEVDKYDIGGCGCFIDD